MGQIKEAWDLYTRDITSPQSYLDFGLYYIIAASLQRRVWCGPAHRPLFPNIYIILVGEPGLGKGLVIKPVTDFLKYHKLRNPEEAAQKVKTPDYEEVDPALVEALNHANYATAAEGKPQQRRSTYQEKLIIPIAADSTTYEALLQDISRSTRFINYKKWDAVRQKAKMEIYIHASLAFCLEEISSLFAKHTESVVNSLLKLYDCGDYTRKTKTQGEDIIKNSCLNFFGGTTPNFIKSIFNDQLLTEGFASRAWFVFEHSNRFNTLMSPELTPEQEAARKLIIDHIEKLTKLYGPVKFAPDAWAYLENWWTNIHPIKKPNPSLKLISYYARKNIHVQKMAMILHFMEDAEMNEMGNPARPITLETTNQAMEILDKTEVKMHYALNFDSRNPLTAIGHKVVKFIEGCGAPQTWEKLLLEFEDEARDHELTEIIEHLRATRKIVTTQIGRNGKTVVGFEIANRKELPTIDAVEIASPVEQVTPEIIDSEQENS